MKNKMLPVPTLVYYETRFVGAYPTPIAGFVVRELDHHVGLQEPPFLLTETVTTVMHEHRVFTCVALDRIQTV